MLHCMIHGKCRVPDPGCVLSGIELDRYYMCNKTQPSGCHMTLSIINTCLSVHPSWSILALHSTLMTRNVLSISIIFYATAPWQLEPEPAVQPKQWLSIAIVRPVSSSKLVRSNTVMPLPSASPCFLHIKAYADTNVNCSNSMQDEHVRASAAVHRLAHNTCVC